MSGADTRDRGLALLATRVAQASGFVSAVPEIFEQLAKDGPPLPRQLVTTGIGTSEGHARHLAEAAARWTGQPARFTTTGSLAGGAPPDSTNDWLVVFSQGLSANARYALQHVEDWGCVVLVTGLGGDEAENAAASADSGKLDWLRALEARGVIRIELGCGVEYGTLLRVIGARVGYAVGWSLLRTLAWRRLEAVPALECEVDQLQNAQNAAAQEVERAFPDPADLAAFFSADRSLVLVSEDGLTELSEQLSLKIAEGMLRPQPRCVDVLNFAHGPLQSLAERPTSILYLSPAEPAAEGSAWLDRFAETLDPAIHDLRVLRAALPPPFSVLEYEAMLDHCVLRGLAQTEIDLVRWPGQDREAPLYASSPALERKEPSAEQSSRSFRSGSLEELTWPEVETQLAAGRRTALIALGSIEQHGPHLALGTDRFIAESLADGLARRLSDAIALPALAVGCASEHLDFPGTLHIEPATLEAVLRDLIGSLRRHGFLRAFVFTAHGGNVEALEEMRPRLVAAASGLDLRIETDLQLERMQSDQVEAASLDPKSAGPHAGEYETSLVAMLRPGSVRRDAMRRGRLVTASEGAALFYPSLRPNASTGVLGDPSQASAERGERYLAAWIDLLEAAYVRAFSGGTEKKRQ